ncbi:RING finger domain protein [Penicillium macrosclerotiorum]|uniref:RING finger domain protein n=1 Tax=Penicillium macrosclerotiorum TaxID=303699 RepID=UPI002546B1EA|nr:RING finger domain protein [Penicillium macrosclerotiorum]KAJ5683278.1 RING finger domain protein [Penicillium macrosclerotiorum]
MNPRRKKDPPNLATSAMKPPCSPQGGRMLAKQARTLTESPFQAAAPRRTRKRKVTGSQTLASTIETADFAEPPARKPAPADFAKKLEAETSRIPVSVPEKEKRSRRWRNSPPISYIERLRRIQKTKMFVVGQEVGGTKEAPNFVFDVVGSTGNIYKVTIDRDPVCDCPDGAKGNQCKHICYGESYAGKIMNLLHQLKKPLLLYYYDLFLLIACQVLLHALKAPRHLQYQLAFLSSELCTMYEGSPLSQLHAASAQPNEDGSRKPVEGDCPVCFMEFNTGDETVWCKASCGNNIHKKCFEKWAAASRSSGNVRCVYCRADWEQDRTNIDVSSIRKSGNPNEEGYFNVAEQFGLSGERGTAPSLYFNPVLSNLITF